MWTKILNAVAAEAGVRATATETVGTAGGHARNDVPPSSPCKSVTFNGHAAVHKYFDGDSFESLHPENGTTFVGSPTSTSGGTSRDKNSVNERSMRDSTIFAHLWADCIGDNTCAAFAGGESSSLPDGMNGEIIDALDPAPSLFQEQPASSPQCSQHHLGPWERLVSALRDERGIDVTRLLSLHEYVLLEREVTDWLDGAEGRQRAELRPGKGMAERLALAADAALHQKDTPSAATPEKPCGVAASQGGARGGGQSAAMGSTATAGTATAAEEGHSGGIPNHGRRRLPVEESHFPMVVVAGGPSKADAETRVLTATAGGKSEGSEAGTTASKPNKSLDRQLDLFGVALDAHKASTSLSTLCV